MIITSFFSLLMSSIFLRSFVVNSLGRYSEVSGGLYAKQNTKDLVESGNISIQIPSISGSSGSSKSSLSTKGIWSRIYSPTPPPGPFFWVV